MSSYIKYYCGLWESKSGNRLEISSNTNEFVSVDFYRKGENYPMLRPWMNNSPAIGMVGTLDPEGGSLDIALSNHENSFCLNLNFDLDFGDYSRVVPSIIRDEKEHCLEQYYDCIGPLDPYEKC